MLNQAYKITVKELIRVSYSLGAFPLDDEDLENLAIHWTKLMSPFIPEELLSPVFKECIATHNNSFPVTQWEMLEIWDKKFRTEEQQKQIDFKKDFYAADFSYDDSGDKEQ